MLNIGDNFFRSCMGFFYASYLGFIFYVGATHDVNE
jgi:hypothetical protein